eukprot:CAMPEP_0201488630 /NCGR_PEP_ID=MMETSP0151_2-20130828/19280_1 /ASSEMBLY_ACC=CAM_ASM_000257 /TAXON_ID=200890 /ORGANISM="Paramoeba atlantica, Strain 621/1 / CCAP 1560/9" /LENGTH=840 /DNA_ID=CAMNT_0047873957 /DNA_START=183 /DNA_END=2702 /DNA_ORIENTATION=+
MANRFEKRDEDEEEAMPFVGLDKGIVLQETKAFSETPVNIRKCCHLLTKVLYLIYQGERLTKNEATDVFFAITKLFQCQDLFLRRLVFLALKELSVMADSVIIVISSLTKDMNSPIDMYRSHAIRVLCKILTDISLLGQGERYLKQAIMDKDISVQSAALVSGVHLLKHSSNVELVKRWFTEVFEASKSRDEMVQYHALGLMYQLRKHDRLAVTKLLGSVRKNVRSPFATCLLIRLVTQLLRDSPSEENAPFFDFLSSCLRNSSDLVMYEAARALSTNNLQGLSTKLLSGSIAALQSLLPNPKAALRFAGIRTLNEVALHHTKEVQLCNSDIENLIGDPNRNIATLAVTTLLKTGDVESVDRLIKEISNFMGELSDEFKVILISAVQTLCAKFPQKYRTLIVFLSEILREEGGFPYKKAIIESILGIMKDVPESKEMALSCLCEFIEDCEFTQLSVQVLDLVGREGPSTPHPSRYIRYIYNRVILENASIRSAAVQALANFGIHLGSLRPSIIQLLRRIVYDSDDEVRDRATFYLSVLEQEEKFNLTEFSGDFEIRADELERSLLDYQHSGFENPFDIDAAISMAIADRPVRLAQESAQKASSSSSSSSFSSDAPSATSRLAAIPEFALYGKVFKSSNPVKLSEDETEYTVSCIKHMFAKHIVFEFQVLNTVSEQELEDVGVKIEVDPASEEELSLISPDVEIEIKSLPYDTPASCYVSFDRDPDVHSLGTFTATLKYTAFNLDSSGVREDDGDDDEYPLEEFDLVIGDYCLRALVPNFHEEWEKYADLEAVETFTLNSVKTLQNAVNEILSHLSLQAIDKTDEVPAKKSKHILFASGIW